jgi:hypothetical protein
MKKHWTQTKAGRARMSEQMKAMWARKNHSTKGTEHHARKDTLGSPAVETHASDSEAKESYAVGYAVGRTKEWLDLYADSNGLSKSALAQWVGNILSRKAGR